MSKKQALKQITPDIMEAVAHRFRALGEPSRLQLLQTLQGGELTVSDIVDSTGLSQPNVSRHLSILVTAGLVGRRKDGLHAYYRIIDKSISEICSIVCHSLTKKG